MTPQEAVELLRECDGALVSGRWSPSRLDNKYPLLEPTGIVSDGWCEVIAHSYGTEGGGEFPCGMEPCQAESLCKLRNALPGLRAVIEDQQREIDRLGSLGVAVYCNGCDFGLTVIQARHVGHGKDNAPVCYECGHKSWRMGQ